MTSIFHFFRSLVSQRSEFLRVEKLEDFPFDEDLLSCRNKGVFPDLAIRISKVGDQYSGGELIEIKDNKTYQISSFNSTIPSGRKKLDEFTSAESSRILQQMRDRGEDPHQMPERDVYYLIRGKKNNPLSIKVCLVHGHFFETIKIKDLIRQSFAQALAEGIYESEQTLDEDTIEKVLTLLCQQKYFRRVRDVPNSSVKLRFRIMTEAKAEANILDPHRYPQILDNTLNLVIPYSSCAEKEQVIEKIADVFGDQFSSLQRTIIQHPFNGTFLVFQIRI